MGVYKGHLRAYDKFMYQSSSYKGNPLISKCITQPSIYGVIVYFLLCHESLNFCSVNIFDY